VFIQPQDLRVSHNDEKGLGSSNSNVESETKSNESSGCPLTVKLGYNDLGFKEFTAIYN